MKFLKIIVINFFIFFLLIIILEVIFGYWFKSENFGIYMRKERKVNWQTESSFNGKSYNFFYQRNFWGFRGNEFDPKDVRIVFEGGSTGNQRFTPEDQTIVGILNKNLSKKGNKFKVYNASTDGKSVSGYINDFKFWFPKIPNFNPKYIIFYIGINDRFNIFDGRYFLDYKVSEKKIAQTKDYVKNNSFIVDKYKTIKNKYFPKNTFAYDFNSSSLYENFIYIDYQQAIEIHKDFNEEDAKLIKNFQKKLNELKSLIDERNIKPIFINQIMFDGLSDKNLFLVNNELKNFAKKNDYLIIPLDEILLMKENDFYDTAHTTPQGSKRIAEKVFPILLNFLKENE